MSRILLETYRKKGINAYLAPCLKDDKPDTAKVMYGKPVEGQEQWAYRGKRHTVEIDLSKLPDGKYVYKEAGGADYNKSIYGWIIVKEGLITEESE